MTRSSSIRIFGARSSLWLCAALLLLAGCNASKPAPANAYETVGKDPRRDAELARRENARAVDLIEHGDFKGAEAALKAALAADIMCGPAHNNLGKVYFRQFMDRSDARLRAGATDPAHPAETNAKGHTTVDSAEGGSLYLAAWEFQYAAKLMPNQPEPSNNLGLVFEAAGKLDEATDSYGKAVALEPDNIHAMGNLARARVRRGDRDAELRALLNRLVLRETRPQWLAWERAALVRLSAPAGAPDDRSATP